eukprot:4387236-Lingulodinium_polyedra.AAC.1
MTDVEVHMSSIKLIKGGREATSFARHLQQDASEKELALLSERMHSLQWLESGVHVDDDDDYDDDDDDYDDDAVVMHALMDAWMLMIDVARAMRFKQGDVRKDFLLGTALMVQGAFESRLHQLSSPGPVAGQ